MIKPGKQTSEVKLIAYQKLNTSWTVILSLCLGLQNLILIVSSGVPNLVDKEVAPHRESLLIKVTHVQWLYFEAGNI